MSPTSKSRPATRDSQRAVLPIALVLLALFAIVALLAWMDFPERSAVRVWAILPGIIGVSAVLSGLFGVAHFAWSYKADFTAVFGHVALMLGGGILLQDGWGAALALGALASTGLVISARRRGDEGESDSSTS